MKKIFILFLLVVCLVGCTSINIPPKSFYVQNIVGYNNTKTLGITTDIFYSVDYNLEKKENLDTLSFNIKSDLYSYEFIFSAKEFQKIVRLFVIAEEKNTGNAHINLGSLHPSYIYITDFNGKTFRGFSEDKFNFNFYNDGNSKQFVIGTFKVTDSSSCDIVYALDDIPIASAEISKINSFIQTENIKNLRKNKIKEYRLVKTNKKRTKLRKL